MRIAAFTLMELLVVIAIISLLAVILFPVFATAREKARQSVCSSNMRQIGLGLMQYVQDNDDVFPEERTNGLYWNVVLTPYTKADSIQCCPDADNRLWLSDDGPKTGAAPAGIGYGGLPISYYANVIQGWPVATNGMGWGAFASIGRPTQTSDFPSPAQTIAIVEGQGVMFPFIEITANNAGTDICTAFTVDGRCLWSGHTGMANYAFCDGHIKAMRPSQTINGARNLWFRPDTIPDPSKMDGSIATMQSNIQYLESKYTK